ncbi:hypothetical protein KL930_005214 [Ogataea haglerorum]|uniref:Uncharacterized protein n=1 Tax=Ogataea haglerorum TaxID=1937702 RepID=A0AAN6HY24_9ASCO|nr:uncharacterized protein KL911_005225 [Ogataea haglerorum]KAG7691584.1 hypothetical protein KL915_005134 [Ogataea haglerorum]KAG7691981.1 hypothetical protein KL951_005185 [Ogataea haglerorum]KAG7702335.1 hypothetical protein KL914_005264 [Ogataea haglerorum]KAG7702439.1 hypothetical protein KL950_005254 [Ogataea haglerorum]KAG7713216.1 hypothetical protein KL913_005197 [Ogataea haglerorum]
MSSTLPSLKQFWKQTLFLSVLAIGTAAFVKSKVTIRRKKQYIKETSSFDSTQKKQIADVKPGFPERNPNEEKYKRKSEFEGAGNSYMSRKHGDKLAWWGRGNE